MYFYVKIATPSEKSHPLFTSKPPLKAEVLSSPAPFWKFGWRLNCPTPLQKGEVGGANYVNTVSIVSLN